MDVSPLEITEKGNGKSVIFPEYFDISVVSDIKSIFAELLAVKPDLITLNTERMEMIDTAGMQLLLAFVIDAKKNDINISYQLGDDCMCRTASTLGLIEHLGLECN